MSQNPNSILESSDPSRFSTESLSHGDNRMIAAKLGRVQHIGEKLEGTMFIRSLIQRLQIAGSEVVGCFFGDTQIQEAEFQGATFRFCQFKKVKFESASFREVRFQSCTFEDCSIQPSMEISEIDNIIFENCYFHDAEERFTSLLKSKAWSFQNCIFATPATLDNRENTFLPLLAFTPAVTAEVAPIRPSSGKAESPSAPPPVRTPAPKETPKAGANRFDQLELG